MSTQNTYAAPDLIIYGGSFDPPHQGHVECITHARKLFPKAEIWIMPAPIPAGADNVHKHPEVSFQDRRAMCELCFTGIDEHIKISSIEQELPAPSYSVQTLRAVRDLYPNKKLALLIGEDQLGQFPKWFKPKEILDLADLVVFSRTHLTNTIAKADDHLRILADCALSNLNIKTLWHNTFAQFVGSDHGLWAEAVQICPAESQTIRAKIKGAETLPSGWLPPKVFDYIRSRRLYSNNDEKH